MWFAFGFISLIGFSIYFFLRRLKSNWAGTKSYSASTAYDFAIVSHKKKVRAVFVGVSVPDTAHFSFKPERWYDRLFKWVGLSVEYQVGDAHFDRRVYIVSDDAALTAQLRANTYLRDDILGFFRFAQLSNWKVAEIACLGGRLWVRYKPPRNTEDVPSGLITGTVPILETTRTHLGIALAPSPRVRDPFVYRAAVLLGISSALAINGGLHLMRLHIGTIPLILDTAALRTFALLCGGVITAILSLGVVVFLARSARAHIVLFEIITIGFFGAFATSLAEIRDLNMELDRSSATVYETVVVEKRVSRSRRSGSTYYVTLAAWGDEVMGREVKVSSTLFDRLPIQGRVALRQRPGYLGLRWVEHIGPIALSP